MITSNMNPHEWASWLEKIQENPGQHDLIVKENGVFKFLDKSKLKSSSQKTLTSAEILKFSQSMLERKDISLLDRYKIINGMKYLNSRRESHYQNLNFISRFIAKLMGVESHLKIEKAEVSKLESGFEGTIKGDKTKRLEFIQEQIQELETRKLGGDFSTLGSKTKLNEMIFEHSKTLHSLKGEIDRDAFKKLETQLHNVNPHIPKVSTIIKQFGQEAIKENLKETVSSLCNLYQVDQNDLKRDCHLFSCDSTEMQAIYVQRMTKVFKTGFSLSTVSGIEKTWQEMIVNKQEKPQEKKIGDHYVVFIPGVKPGEGEVLVKEKYLKSGTFKAAFLASSFFNVKKAEARGEMVVLQPVSTAQEQIKEAEEAQKKKAEAEKEQKAKVEKNKQPTDSQSMATSESSSSDQLSLEDGETEEEYSSIVIHESIVIDKKETAEKARPTEEDGETEEEYSSIVIHKSAVIDKKETEEKSRPTEEDGEAEEEYSSIVIHKSAVIDKKEGVKEESKVMSKSVQNSEESELSSLELEREEYRKEAEMCKELGGLPGVWSTYKVTEINGETAIIQKAAGYKITPKGKREEIRAIELADMHNLSKEGELTPTQQVIFLNMIKDALIGIQSIHKQNYIHRDLKPANILCSPEGKAGVSDLGTVCKDQIVDENGDLTHNPEKSTIIGTPYYIAPEIVNANADKVSAKADIWSTGMILWELLSNEEVSDHPALGGKNPSANVALLKLALLGSNNSVLATYKKNFPEPNNADSILHLIWSCTRVAPEERPDADILLTRYDQWASKIQQQLEKGTIASIEEAFKKELNDYLTFLQPQQTKQLPTQINVDSESVPAA